MSRVAGNAPADSLLGQLQRGCGLGFLRALREDASVVRPLLLDCLLHDPRWDRQVETRADYYAALIAHTALPLEPLDAHLRAAETVSYNLYDLALDTLCALAARGYAPAVAILRAYLTYGDYWDVAFEALMEGARDIVDVQEVSGVINRRFPDDATLDAELPSPGPDMHTRQEPWQSLRAVNPRVDRLLNAHEREAEQRQRHEEQVRSSLAGLSVPELLAVGVDDRTTRFKVKALQERVTTGNLDLLLEVAQHGDHRQQFVAFRGLEQLAHPASFPIVRAFLKSPWDESRSAHRAAVRVMEALPAALTLDLARNWFDSSDAQQRHIARLILKAHATIDDVPRARVALRSSLREGSAEWRDYYLTCGMLEILARFPEAGPYPEAEAVFEGVEYAYARRYAADVLAASEPDRFARGLALECLWDCESHVRETGCDGVDLAVPGARARLQELSSDPHEVEDVRDAAKERITYPERS